MRPQAFYNPKYLKDDISRNVNIFFTNLELAFILRLQRTFHRRQIGSFLFYTTNWYPLFHRCMHASLIKEKLCFHAKLGGVSLGGNI